MITTLIMDEMNSVSIFEFKSFSFVTLESLESINYEFLMYQNMSSN